jgi:wyosine [tRNA(Phe)-imidazoG37] synthetase (radical SAM superfamily)
MQSSDVDKSIRMKQAWRSHERRWRDNKYAYAVVSRRSKGISVGINLNPDKGCNFDCIYCQVDRSIPPQTRKVDLPMLARELDSILAAEQNGSLYDDAPFNVLTPSERGVRDIAFSGDGEPTVFPRFEDAVRIAAQARRKFRLDSTKLILITNGAYLDRPGSRAGLSVMDENNGEIWAKLDAGDDARFKLVNRPNVSLSKVLENILSAARVRPVVIQSLWLKIGETAPSSEEIDAYCRRLNDILEAGGKIKSIQLYTVARNPGDPSASPLTREELDHIASIVKSSVPITIESFF